MNSKRREYPEVCLENSWYPEFSSLRVVRDSTTLAEFKKEIGADGDDISVFFTDSDDTAPPCEIKVLEEFCRGTSLGDLESGRGTAGNEKIVWIDDRSSGRDLEGSGDARLYENPKTATELYQAWKQKRFDGDDLPDAARRLVYITDLSPACIHALAATASWLQAPVLRNAIYKHLAFQTSIAVKAPSAGFLTFQLDLHLPFFILGKSTPPKHSAEKVNTKPRRRWTDLSFLQLDATETQDQDPKEVWGIHEAQISFVVTGTDDWRWVAFCFVDTEIDGVLADSSNTDLCFDQIAAGQLQANFPIWRPRDYWIKIFDTRIEQVRRKWDYLALMLEQGVNQYVRFPITSHR
ncbi:hypothetical protein DL95DRAFT_321621 [Leptodontidium sp. 2 PMI_412]|nr:hypothetical protein DL95DRAFT_321621 [Leptodontidium sp. 2 PMI_412]